MYRCSSLPCRIFLKTSYKSNVISTQPPIATGLIAMEDRYVRLSDAFRLQSQVHYAQITLKYFYPLLERASEVMSDIVGSGDAGREIP